MTSARLQKTFHYRALCVPVRAFACLKIGIGNRMGIGAGGTPEILTKTVLVLGYGRRLAFPRRKHDLVSIVAHCTVEDAGNRYAAAAPPMSAAA